MLAVIPLYDLVHSRINICSLVPGLECLHGQDDNSSRPGSAIVTY